MRFYQIIAILYYKFDFIIYTVLLQYKEYKAFMSNQVKLQEEKEPKFQVFEIVWGKLTGYPWWPTRIVNIFIVDAAKIPNGNVKNIKSINKLLIKKNTRNNKNFQKNQIIEKTVYEVQFVGQTSYAYMEAKNIQNYQQNWEKYCNPKNRKNIKRFEQSLRQANELIGITLISSDQQNKSSNMKSSQEKQQQQQLEQQQEEDQQVEEQLEQQKQQQEQQQSSIIQKIVTLVKQTTNNTHKKPNNLATHPLHIINDEKQLKSPLPNHTKTEQNNNGQKLESSSRKKLKREEKYVNNDTIICKERSLRSKHSPIIITDSPQLINAGKDSQISIKQKAASKLQERKTRKSNRKQIKKDIYMQISSESEEQILDKGDSDNQEVLKKQEAKQQKTDENLYLSESNLLSKYNLDKIPAKFAGKLQNPYQLRKRDQKEENNNQPVELKVLFFRAIFKILKEKFKEGSNVQKDEATGTIALTKEKMQQISLLLGKQFLQRRDKRLKKAEDEGRIEKNLTKQCSELMNFLRNQTQHNILQCFRKIKVEVQNKQKFKEQKKQKDGNASEHLIEYTDKINDKTEIKQQPLMMTHQLKSKRYRNGDPVSDHQEIID